MNLLDAVRSGLPFRLPSQTDWLVVNGLTICHEDEEAEKNYPFGQALAVRTVLLSDDWKVREPEVTITNSTFWSAYQDALKAWGNQDTMVVRGDPPIFGRFCQHMANTLGLKDVIK